MKCKTCKNENPLKMTFKPNSVHIECRCNLCSSHIKFLDAEERPSYSHLIQKEKVTSSLF